MLFEGLRSGFGADVPNGHDALVVTGRENLLEIVVPYHARNFAIANHFVDRVVDVDRSVPDGAVIVEDLDSFRDAGDGEIFAILVELDTGHDRRDVV